LIPLQRQFLEQFKEWEKELGLLNSSPKNSWLLAILAVAMLGCIGLIHYFLRPEFTLSLSYLIPVGFASWYIGTRYGLFLSVLSVAAWIFVEIASNQPTSPFGTYCPYAFARLSFCVGVTLLLGRFKTALRAEQTLSRVDYLTGAVNWRSFYESTSMEIERCNRYGCSFTIAYIDIDNFKDLNDRFGHTTGDNVLQAIANTVKINIRKVDIVARLGGDEFVILFPETAEKAASIAIQKIKNALLQNKYLKKLSVTFSMGILTCKECPPSVDSTITLADSLMYSAKKQGKNGIAQSIYTG
jgi:diguanylate cyclase (GGDEF)-like protein